MNVWHCVQNPTCATQTHPHTWAKNEKTPGTWMSRAQSTPTTSLWGWPCLHYHNHRGGYQRREACRLSHCSRHKVRWHPRRRILTHSLWQSCFLSLSDSFDHIEEERRRDSVSRWRNHSCLRLELVHALSWKMERSSRHFLRLMEPEYALSHGGRTLGEKYLCSST